MNPKVQLEKLRTSIEWLLYHIFLTKQTFNAVMAVLEATGKSYALSTYGDYLAYTQNIMIDEVQLQLAKLFVENQDSHSLAKVISIENSLFTECYYKKTGYNQHKSYEELKDELQQLKFGLKELENLVSNLKKLRNKNLAHLDKKIFDLNSLEILTQSNSIYLADAQSLINFAVKNLSMVKAIIFNIWLDFNKRDYSYELEQIAKAITEQRSKQLEELNRLGGGFDD